MWLTANYQIVLRGLGDVIWDGGRSVRLSVRRGISDTYGDCFCEVTSTVGGLMIAGSFMRCAKLEPGPLTRAAGFD